MKKMKILEVIDSHGWCGTKEQTYLITKYLSKYINVDLALAYDHKEMIEKLEGIVPLKFYEEDKGSKRRFDIKNYKRLKKIIEEGNYDVVVANSSWSYNYVIGVYPFLKRKPKLIAIRRSGYVPSIISKYLKYKWADRIVVVSKQVAELLKKKNFFPEKLVTIESGIELSRFTPSNKFREEYRKKLNISGSKKVFINVANWQPCRKGQDILLKAFKKLNCENCKLLLVGHNTDSEEARKMIKGLGLENKVIGLGYRTDVEKLLQASDFFVLSSNSEGIAGALLQAMASGKVVLSTLAGGIGEYLEDRKNGFAVPIGDIESMVEKMRKILSLFPEDYKIISENAVQTAEKYSIEKTVKKYIELFQEVV